MGELQTAWQQRLETSANRVALVLAESGAEWTFRGLDQWAESFLEQHACLRERKGAVFAFSATDPVEWLGLYLVALKRGLVVMPMESVGIGDVDARTMEALGVSFYKTSGELGVLEGGGVFDGIHLIKLTSGSTGAPQPLAFTERAMAADGRQIMRTMGFDGRDRNYAVIPLGYSYGLGNLVMPWVLEGTQIVIASAAVPQVIADEIERFQCTLFPAVPPLLRALAMSDISPEKLASLRLVVSAGSRLESEDARRFFDRFRRPIHNFYGSSETGGICFDRTGEATLTGDGVGAPLEGVSVSLDAAGAIFVKSEAVCPSMASDEGCRLYDFGRWNDRGELELTGRDQDLIKIGGKRLFLVEVERAICSLEGVEDAYVTHRPSRRGDVQIVAVLLGTLAPEDVRGRLRACLSAWKIPKRIYNIQTMPYTARGKKDRQALESLVDIRMKRG